MNSFLSLTNLLAFLVLRLESHLTFALFLSHDTELVVALLESIVCTFLTDNRISHTEGFFVLFKRILSGVLHVLLGGNFQEVLGL